MRSLCHRHHVSLYLHLSTLSLFLGSLLSRSRLRYANPIFRSSAHCYFSWIFSLPSPTNLSRALHTAALRPSTLLYNRIALCCLPQYAIIIIQITCTSTQISVVRLCLHPAPLAPALATPIPRYTYCFPFSLAFSLLDTFAQLNGDLRARTRQIERDRMVLCGSMMRCVDAG